MKIGILDTETTGLDDTDQIIELAIIVYQVGDTASPDADVVLEYEQRFKPTVPIKEEAAKAHGITMADLEDKPVFLVEALRVAQILGELDIISGYNVDFDLRMLCNTYVAAKVEYPVRNALVVDAHRLWKVLEPRSLGAAHKKFVGFEFENAHSALADVQATNRVLHGIIQHFGKQDLTWEQLAELADPDRKTRFGVTHHLRWNEQGRLIFTFGKMQNQPVWASDRGYLRWMLNQSFPYHVRLVCEKINSFKTEEDFNAWARSV